MMSVCVCVCATFNKKITELQYLMSWSTHDGREDGARGIISGEAGLAHAGAVVNDNSLDGVVVTHDWYEMSWGSSPTATAESKMLCRVMLVEVRRQETVDSL